MDFGQAFATVEGGVADLGDAVRQNNAVEVGAAFERGERDAPDTIFNEGRREIFTVEEGVCAEFREACGQGDLLEGRAERESVISQMNQAVRQRCFRYLCAIKACFPMLCRLLGNVMPVKFEH